MKEGTAWSAIVINEQFTDDLLLRICSVLPDKCGFPRLSLSEEMINQSTIHIYSDLSSKELKKKTTCVCLSLAKEAPRAETSCYCVVSVYICLLR